MASLPPPPPDTTSAGTKRKPFATWKIALIGAVVVVGALAVAAALLGNSDDPDPRAVESPATTAAPEEEPSPSPIPTLDSVVDGFTQELLDTGGYPLRYALLDETYFDDKDADLAPLVLLVWGDTPKSFNQWTILQNALRMYAGDLEEQGIRS